MADLKYQPVVHQHAEFLAKARQRPGFNEAYDSLELEYAVVSQMIKARAKAGLTQQAVAERMGTTKSAISRLEATGRHAPSLTSVERVYSHPQALAQCQGWLSQHLPQAERRAVSSNAEGARLAATNPHWAGIASERAAAQFGLHTVAHAIQDEAYNRTRFAVISLPQTMATPPATGRDCTSLVVSVPNRPGAVHDLLVPLKNHGVSMTRFESRPAKSGQWEYYFYIDIQGHITDAPVIAALKELQGLCAFYKVLGSYPVSD